MAKKFKFNLQPVLRYREMIEQQKMKDFAIANRAVEDEKIRLDNLRQQRENTQQDVRDMYSEGGDFHHIVDQFRYINTLDVNLVRGGQKMAKLESVRDVKRDVFINARKDRRALEILRDKRLEEHDFEAAREIQNELDQLSVSAKRRRDDEERLINE